MAEEILTPEAEAALSRIKARRSPPRLSGRRFHEREPDGAWTITIVRADGKRTWITRPTLSAALVRAAEIADEMAADARTVARA